MICNCEGPVGSRGLRKFPYWGRLWRIESNGDWSRLYEQKLGENINHENWNHTGEHIVYHGNKYSNYRQRLFQTMIKVLWKLNVISKEQLQRNLNHYVEARDWDGSLVFHFPVKMPVSHAVSAGGRNFIIDSRDGYLYLVKEDRDENFKVEKLCIHNSDMSNQDAHPHPVPTNDKKSILFTSSKEGTCNVYEVEI